MPAHSGSLPRAVLVDIDGTLALRGDGPRVRAFHHWHRVSEDRPNPAVVELVQAISAADRHHIVLLTGRDEVCRPQTAAWLNEHRVPYDEMHMRPRHDGRTDSVIKRELYERHVAGRYSVAFVIDDRTRVVRMWRDELGLTVLQCADGDF